MPKASKAQKASQDLHAAFRRWNSATLANALDVSKALTKAERRGIRTLRRYHRADGNHDPDWMGLYTTLHYYGVNVLQIVNPHQDNVLQPQHVDVSSDEDDLVDVMDEATREGAQEDEDAAVSVKRPRQKKEPAPKKERAPPVVKGTTGRVRVEKPKNAKLVVVDLRKPNPGFGDTFDEFQLEFVQVPTEEDNNVDILIGQNEPSKARSPEAQQPMEDAAAEEEDKQEEEEQHEEEERKFTPVPATPSKSESVDPTMEF
jgi:hypothetical protein